MVDKQLQAEQEEGDIACLTSLFGGPLYVMVWAFDRDGQAAISSCHGGGGTVG